MTKKVADRGAGAGRVKPIPDNGVLPEDHKPVFGKMMMPKEDVHDWPPLDARGKFEWIDKNALFIDHEYQRDRISNNRVLEIANKWSWRSCGVIMVARREDQTCWAFDGQHRVLAARKRSDITKLPCLVFFEGGKEDEARAFLGTNTVRGAMRIFDKHKAALVAKDAAHIAITQMVEADGYRIVPSTNRDREVACVSTLLHESRVNPSLCARVWKLAVEVTGGKTITRELFAGLCYLERYLVVGRHGSACEGKHREKLIAAGTRRLMREIKDEMADRRKGGPKVWANGLLNALNYKCRNPIPSIYAAERDGVDV